ncbi:MAG: glutamate-5-semialdehyde dehydrogenase [Eubacteriales bacterium]|nr:glutamate-5-semialdehyde dehydrogenase [Eubacteriales bacterium]
MSDLEKQAIDAKKAALILMNAGTAEKNRALAAIADEIIIRQPEWLEANDIDMEKAKQAGLSKTMLDRLRLTPERIEGIADGVRQVISLPDPVGVVDKMSERPNGLIIGRRRVPLGVIGIIFEARPNVTVDAAVLCLKSGNVCILRGGKEAINSNKVAARIMQDALEKAGLPKACIQLVQDTSHETADELMHMNDYIDVLIPRGGRGLIRRVATEASVPVIRTGEGVCHIYIDNDADLDMGARILENAKCSRPSVCNAAECVLVHKDIEAEFLKKAIPFLDKYEVALRCDEQALAVVGSGRAEAANEEDWDTEYGDYVLAVKTVESFDEAVEFINTHGTGHSEAIVTESYSKAQKFLDRIDAAAVYVNASTRFTDGGEFGLGAEIGISTQKLHARGPMGLEELTSCKYVIYGSGQIR